MDPLLLQTHGKSPRQDKNVLLFVFFWRPLLCAGDLVNWLPSLPPGPNMFYRALKVLLEHHHDVSVKDDRGQTLLHLAASFGLEDAIATLLKAPGGMELLDVKERLHCRYGD